MFADRLSSHWMRGDPSPRCTVIWHHRRDAFAFAALARQIQTAPTPTDQSGRPNVRHGITPRDKTPNRLRKYVFSNRL